MLVTNEVLKEVASQQRGSYRPVASFGTLENEHSAFVLKRLSNQRSYSIHKLSVSAQSADDVWVKPYVTQVTVVEIRLGNVVELFGQDYVIVEPGLPG